MGYDLMNEPWPGTDVYTCMNPVGCPVHDDTELQAMPEHVRRGIREVDAENLDDADLATVKPKLRILERTYPQATAGLPLELSFDPDTADFFHRYQVRAASAPTEIYVPVGRHYAPGGYAVEVTGARVTSRPGVTRLAIENEPGAREVQVRIRRA